MAKLSFGATPGQIAEVSRIGANRYIADQLNRSGPDADLDRRMANFTYLNKSPVQILDNLNKSELYEELNFANFVRARYSKNQLFEMVCHLWMDHFNVNLASNLHLHPEYQERTIRANAMGTFRDLLRATANSPAMLHYLNNDISNASDALKVNENYGRELLELHSLGVDAEGKHVYTQTDVENVSLVMAGWSARLNPKRDGNQYGTFIYRDDYAYNGELSILNGAWSSAGLTGKARGDSLVDFLATHPSTARHIAFKICRRFVSDTPSSGLIASTAAVYQQNNTAIVPVLKHVFESNEFAQSGGSKVRRPFEFLAATMRAVNASVTVGPDRGNSMLIRNFLKLTRNTNWSWNQPDGFPDVAAYWIAADSFMARWSYAGSLARGRRVPGITVDIGSLWRAAGGNTVGEVTTNLGRQFGLGTLTGQAVAATVGATGKSPGAAASSVAESDVETIIGLLLANPLFQIR